LPFDSVLTKTPGKLPGASFSLARPDIAHVIVLRDPANKGKMIGVRELQANVPKLSLMLRVIGVRNGKDIEHAFSAVGRRVCREFVCSCADVEPTRQFIR
jgi:hypothetical protein